MKSFLLKNGRVVNSASEKVEFKDLLIKNGRFSELSNQSSDTEIIDLEESFILPGLFDLRCHINQPGISVKESMNALSEKAVSGGYTSILAMPSLSSMADNQETIFYTKDSIISKQHVNIYLTGCLTLNSKGENLAPLGSLKESGVVAVTDCPSSTQNNQIYTKAVEYASMFNMPIIELARDVSLSPEASAHEGLLSLKMGLKGYPRIAEELFVSRSILLSKYTNAKIHLTSISSRGSVDLIRGAKKEGVEITCDVTSNHLCYTERLIENYDSFAKATPPFREEEDRKALIEGLMDKTIDAISTGHQPFSIDDKLKEFDLAPSGVLGLENSFYQAFLELKMKTEEKLLFLANKMSRMPSKILGLKPETFKDGEKANIFVFNTKGKTTLSREFEKEVGGTNLPFGDRKFDGKIIHTFVNGEKKL